MVTIVLGASGQYRTRTQASEFHVHLHCIENWANAMPGCALASRITCCGSLFVEVQHLLRERSALRTEA